MIHKHTISQQFGGFIQWGEAPHPPSPKERKWGGVCILGVNAIYVISYLIIQYLSITDIM
jgi:hypothetical protein